MFNLKIAVYCRIQMHSVLVSVLEQWLRGWQGNLWWTRDIVGLVHSWLFENFNRRHKKSYNRPISPKWPIFWNYVGPTQMQNCLSVLFPLYHNISTCYVEMLWLRTAKFFNKLFSKSENAAAANCYEKELRQFTNWALSNFVVDFPSGLYRTIIYFVLSLPLVAFELT